MDTFLSTYRKDYRWPVKLPSQQNATMTRNVSSSNELSSCTLKPLIKDFVVPQTQAVNSCAASQTPLSQQNQPDAFLCQMYETNPYLYNIEKSSSTDDLRKRVLGQRFISTYQRDYGQQDEVKQSGAGDKKGEYCCKCITKEEPKFTRHKPTSIPRLRSMSTPAGGSNGGSNNSKGNSKGDLCSSQKPGISEYMDSISRTGTLIVKEKLLSNKKK
ncbi:uncharacterized protein LOC142319261 [Lycorma delicatula]|uniref:uncharacterized protein LOC142319261 n=1 Tax=Lycorma delicatula TaxID=130591 RepID=UPI003F516136